MGSASTQQPILTAGQPEGQPPPSDVPTVIKAQLKQEGTPKPYRGHPAQVTGEIAPTGHLLHKVSRQGREME